MASITWGLPSPGRSGSEVGVSSDYAPLFTPTPSSRKRLEEAGRVSPSLLTRVYWQHPAMFNAAQELLLLLVVGGSATVLTFGIDKLISALTDARAQIAQDNTEFILMYVVWSASSLLLCVLSVACVHFIGPHAAGSGIPQMKCVLAGVDMPEYLSLRTLLAKATSMVFALVGGLSIGKEGPYVHMASCVAHQIMRLPPFERLRTNEHLHRQVLGAACAAGVSATFGAPVGGVLFAIEVTSTYYSISHLWKAMFTSVCGAVLFRIGRDLGSLALFRLTTFSSADLGSTIYNGEMFYFLLLGLICGLLGAGFVHATASLVILIRQLRTAIGKSREHKRAAAAVLLHNRRSANSPRAAAAPDRPAWLAWLAELGDAASRRLSLTPEDVVAALLSRYGYPLVVAFTSAMLTFPFGFFRSAPEEVVNDLFGAAPFDFSARWSNPSLLANLLIFIACKFVFTVIAIGCPISCGVYTPVFLIGAAFGRCFGEVLNVLTPAEQQITAGAYAVVGAAAMSAGVTRTVSCAVIVFELTGQLNHMLPVLVAVLAAYGTGNMINSSIYDTMLELNNLPYLRPPNHHDVAEMRASDLMDLEILSLSATSSTYLDAHALLRSTDEAEFAVVDDTQGRVLIGTVRRAVLEALVEKRLLSTRTSSRPSLNLIETLRATWHSAGKDGDVGWAERVRQLQGQVGSALMSPVPMPPILRRRSTSASADPSPQQQPPPRPLDDGGGVGGGDGIPPSASVSVAVEASPDMSRPPPLEPASEGASSEGAASSASGGGASSAAAGEGAGEGGSSEFTPEQQRLLSAPLELNVQPDRASARAPIVDLAPTILTAGMPVHQVHMQFSLLGLERAYVTFAGKLLGVIRREQLNTCQS